MASSPHPLPASRLSRQTLDSSCSPPPPLPPDSVYTSCYCEENIYLLAQNFLAEVHTQTSRGLAWPWEIYVVFISNRGKTVALWSQKLRAPQVVVWDYHVVLVLRPAASIPDIKSRGNLHGDREQLKTCAQVSASSPHVGPRVTQVPASKSEERGPEDPKLPTETFNIDLGHAEPFNAGWVYDFDTTLDVPCPCIDYLARTFPYTLDGALRSCIDDRFRSFFRIIPAKVYVDNFASDRAHMIIRAPQPEVGLATSGNSTVGGVSPDGSNAPLGLDGGHEGDRGVDGPDLRMVGGEASTVVHYSSLPPPYPPLRGTKAREHGITDNLMESFVSMEPDAPSSRNAEEDEPEKGLRTSPRVGSSDDDGNAATVQRVGDRSARGAVRYGQVMDVGAFMSWLSIADDASAPRQQGS